MLILDNSLTEPTNSEHRENEIGLVDPSVSNDDGKNLKHRMQYSLQFKANVIYEYEAEQNQTKIDEKFNIDRRLVGDWVKNKNTILSTAHKRSRSRVVSKNEIGKYPEMESKLLEWFDNKRKENNSIQGWQIKRQAMIIFNDIYQNTTNIPVFQASAGWLSGWLSRNNKTLRRITTTGRELPSNTKQILEKYFADCVELLRKINFNRSQIYNMDETSIYLDCPSKFSYASKGAKRVKVSTHGGELARMSACFAANANGDKLPIYILVPRKNELPDYIPPQNVVITYKTSATFNEDIEVDYLEKVFAQYENSILFLDSACCHLTEKVQNKLDQLKIKKFIIPPRMTNLLQPADVCWFSTIKKKYCKKWSDWACNSDKTYTVHGNTRSPGYVLAIQWLSEIWENFPTHQIINSFDSCGITGNNMLHTTLKSLVQTNQIFNYYVDDYEEEEDIFGFEEGDELFENGANEKSSTSRSLNFRINTEADSDSENETKTDDHLPEINVPIQSFQIEPLSSNAAPQETLPSQSIGEIPITHNYASNNFLNRYEAYEPFNYHRNQYSSQSLFLNENRPFFPTYSNQMETNLYIEPNLPILPFQSKSTPQTFRTHLVLPQSVLAQSVLPESVLAKSVLDKQRQKDQLVSESTPKLVVNDKHVKKRLPLINITNAIETQPIQEKEPAQTQKKTRGRPALPRDENGKIIRVDNIK